MRAKRKTVGAIGYYDNSLVVDGHRVSVVHHPAHGWFWFFDDQDRAPVKGEVSLRNVRTAEDEVRAILPAEHVAREKALTSEYGPRASNT